MSNITVLNGCNDVSVQESLRTALDLHEGISLLDEVWDDDMQLLALARNLKPDVFLMEAACHSIDGVSLLLQVHVASPVTKILLFCESWGRQDVVEALGNGAKGCIGKTSAPAQWLKAIRLIHDGDIWIDRHLLAEALIALLHDIPGKYHLLESKPEILTEREREVVRWVELGMTNKEIARQMNISDTTVKTHLQHIFGKLHIGRRSML
ncbi:MAG: response regulator transcription factor [Burkholderiales bacterium]|nr:response regulator transcription factor [Burkholderiales bacterium]